MEIGDGDGNEQDGKQQQQQQQQGAQMASSGLPSLLLLYCLHSCGTATKARPGQGRDSPAVALQESHAICDGSSQTQRRTESEWF
jgi:hypothetical protein